MFQKILYVLVISVLVASVSLEAKSRPKKTVFGVSKRKEELMRKLNRIFPNDRAKIEDIFSDPRLELISRATPKPQQAEKKHKKGINPYFQEPVSMLSLKSWNDGRKYLDKHIAALNFAEEKYGVPKVVIVGILRIETYFGKGLGRHPAINYLYTLYVRGYKTRSFVPLKQIVCLLNIIFRYGWDVFTIPGSPMGAIGIPQFIPSSYNSSLAVDGEGNWGEEATVDLFRDEDAVMSVGKFLKEKGWGKKDSEKKRALRAYNKPANYGQAVLVYSQLIQKNVYDEEFVKKFTELHEITKRRRLGKKK